MKCRLCVLAAGVPAEKANTRDSGVDPADRIAPAIIIAALGAGSTLISASQGGNGHTYLLASGVKIDADRCWQDGSGPCPNGNCLDYKGRR